MTTLGVALSESSLLVEIPLSSTRGGVTDLHRASSHYRKYKYDRFVIPECSWECYLVLQELYLILLPQSVLENAQYSTEIVM